MKEGESSGQLQGEDILKPEEFLLVHTYREEDSVTASECDITTERTLRELISSPSKPHVSVLDVAEYILRKSGRMSTMKLQKLVYYCQAWSLVWDEKPLFDESIEAWANGPVIRELFNYHRGMFQIDRVYTGNPALLSEEQEETVDAVLDFYGEKPAQWLIDLSHSEQPWRLARRGLPDSARGWRAISLPALADYYSSIDGA